MYTSIYIFKLKKSNLNFKFNLNFEISPDIGLFAWLT